MANENNTTEYWENIFRTRVKHENEIKQWFAERAYEEQMDVALTLTFKKSILMYCHMAIW